jgi:heat-inducible transcriptional repressor
MDELTSRQKQILAFVIDAYIVTTLPVGSRTLAERYRFGLSPASLRHEMGILEERGYLTHPHTSAGRVPTDKGYHLYVKESVKEEPLSSTVMNIISREMKGKIENLESLMGQASRILSAIAEETVLVISPELRELYLKELSLVPWDETRLLAVWRTTSGLVQDCLVEMGEPIASEEIEKVRNFINEELKGQPIKRLEEELFTRIQSQRDSLRRLYERTLQIIQRSLPYWGAPRVFVEGSRYIVSQPEFQDVKKLQPLMTLLEAKSNLVELLSHRPTAEGVSVAIGATELSKEIWDCSWVSAPYLCQGKYMGTLGVLGPRRMPYGRIIGLVHHMAEEMSHALERRGMV